MSDNLLEAALQYASWGWHVFPLVPNTKIPHAGTSGYHEATTDPEIIKKWWRRWPGSNIGVACRPSGVIVIDVDVKRGGDGYAAFGALQAELGFSTETPTSWTPSGGCHLFYALDPEVELAAATLAPNVEIKWNGYAVLPPSCLGKAEGQVAGPYRWDPMLHPGELALLPFPDELLERLIKKDAEKAPVIASEGDRPGDRWAAVTTWEEILRPHGWTMVKKRPDGVMYWRRPGKEGGHSATTGYAGGDFLYVFSTNAQPFEARRGYSKFSAYALLNHNGDFKAAAKALVEAGFGRQGPKPEIPAEPVTWQSLARIIPEVSWAWEPWLPKGLLTLLVGGPGEGKSALALAIAKIVLEGGPWPDGRTGEDGGGLVVWAETEAAQAVNLERAQNWGLPLERLVSPVVNHPLDDLVLDQGEGWAALERAARMPGVKLVVIDSLRGAHRGDENSSETIELLTRLAALARDTQVPLLVVHHLRKRGMLDDHRVNLDRVRGSSAIVQVARVVWAIDRPDPHLPDRVRLAQIKNNLARFPEPLGFEIEAKGIVWTEAPEEPKEETLRDVACDLLLALLAKGPVPASQIYKEAEEAGISKDTVRRAKKALGIVAKRRDKRWWWALPAQEMGEE